jgi:hypothetical protein
MCCVIELAMSFRGRDRRERSPEPITTGRWYESGGGATVANITAWGYGFRARRQIGLTDLPAPRNDIREFVKQ